ncbi:MAG: hypothetical protein N2595_02025 [bacterium]|nr:hypothetical protein [bacterium]
MKHVQCGYNPCVALFVEQLPCQLPKSGDLSWFCVNIYAITSVLVLKIGQYLRTCRTANEHNLRTSQVVETLGTTAWNELRSRQSLATGLTISAFTPHE